MEHRYSLEQYSGSGSRYECPNCGKKEFTRYVDLETNQHIDRSVGKCNRADKCGYHKAPRQYFEEIKATGMVPENNYSPKRSLNFNTKVIKPASYIDRSIFLKSLHIPDYKNNRFVKYLNRIFGSKTTTALIEKYYIGNSNHWSGATIFWQIDIVGRTRSGKVMFYNPATGKRSKDGYHNPNWVHRTEKLPDFNFKQCLFGEHLLRGNNDPVAIVESEKTAIIASVYKPGIIWLAAGGKDGLIEDKCEVLKGRKVELFPDLKSYSAWLDKATELSHIADFTVSDYLERIATAEEKQQGLDIADYLVKIAPAQDSALKQEPATNSMSLLIDEYRLMSQKLSDGEITIDEYTVYNKQLPGKLISAGITVEEFVTCTKDL